MSKSISGRTRPALDADRLSEISDKRIRTRSIEVPGRRTQNLGMWPSSCSAEISGSLRVPPPLPDSPGTLNSLLFSPIVHTRSRTLFALDWPGGLDAPHSYLGRDPASDSNFLSAAFSWLSADSGKTSLVIRFTTGSQPGVVSLLTIIDQAASAACLLTGRVILELVHGPEPAGLELFDCLEEARALGFRLAITGTSGADLAFESLLGIRPDYLRLGEFVIRGCESDFYRQAIIEAVSQLAWKFGAQVIGTGVTTEDEFEVLERFGITLISGRHLCPALPPQEVERRWFRVPPGPGRERYPRPARIETPGSLEEKRHA